MRRTFKVEKGKTVLMHAAAGGVGLILCQWANHLGANVIGTVGSKEKAALAKANGCHHTILYRDEDFVARVKEITGGKLCDVVYDGIGKTTFPASLDCIRPLGMFVSFGSASGQIEAFNINILQTKGSLFATRPTLNTYAAKREDLLAIANDLFDVVGSGAVKIPINQKYPLRDAQKAHRDLEGRADHRLVDPGAVRRHMRTTAESPEPKIWGYWATFGWAVLAFFVGQFVALAVLVAWQGRDVAGDAGNGRSTALRSRSSSGLESDHDRVIAARGAARALERRRLSRPWSGRSGETSSSGSISVVVLIAVCDALIFFSGHDLVTPFQSQSYTSAAEEGWLPAMWIAAIVVAPAGEEVLFRGLMYRGWVRSDRSAWPAIVVISLLWAALHVQYDMVRHRPDFRRRAVSRLDTLAQRLDAADVPAARLVQSRRHDRDCAADSLLLVTAEVVSAHCARDSVRCGGRAGAPELRSGAPRLPPDRKSARAPSHRHPRRGARSADDGFGKALRSRPPSHRAVRCCPAFR